MTEYIEREAAVYELEHDAPEQVFYSRNDAIDCIRALPAADVKPVRHGVWIPDDYEYNRCSECGFEHDDPEYITPYCPNCGAKMDLEAGGHD